MHQYHGTNRRRSFLLDHGSPVPGFLLANSPSFFGGDIYIACPFWDSPFKLLVFLRPHMYHRVPRIRRNIVYVNGFAPSLWDEQKRLEVKNRVPITIKSGYSRGAMWCDVNEGLSWTSAEYAISKQSDIISEVRRCREKERKKEKERKREELAVGRGWFCDLARKYSHPAQW